MTLRRLLAFLLAVVLIAGSSPAEAADSAATARRKREQARQKKAQVAAQINELKASDVQLERAVAALTDRVRAVSAQAASARQAVAVAQAEVAKAEERLAATQTRATDIETAVKARAVETYMRPTTSSLSAITDARTIDEASRRQLLVAQLANRDRDALDELRAVREDVELQRAAAEASRQKAAERTKQVTNNLRQLEKAKADKQRLEAALDKRIGAFQAEADALGREEVALAAVIRERESQARASRSAASAAGVSSGDGGRVSGSGLIWPVRGTVTSEYGARWGRRHEGIDIGAPTGTPIRAAKAGTVIFVGQQGGYGNITIVDHGGGFSTTYPHQSRFGTSEGAEVSQGQVIGYVGCSGSCTGPHLHFETRVGGTAVNPRRYLP
jgi:murein DD-endopeptidase MepM/ murein hydrolase activator NlpD